MFITSYPCVKSVITARKRSLGQGNIFTPVCHSVHRVAPEVGHAWLLLGGCMVARGACVVAPGGHAWLLPGGVHGCSGGCVCGCSWGVCMVAPEGHAWLLPGGMHGCSQGACVVAPRGACVVAPGGRAWLLPGGGHAWDTMTHRDTVNERAVCILLECILVYCLCLVSKEKEIGYLPWL